MRGVDHAGERVDEHFYGPFIGPALVGQSKFVSENRISD
jgi:hypothetical protein